MSHSAGRRLIDGQVQELDKHRTRTAKHHLLTRAIATVSPPESSKPLGPRQPRSQQAALPEPLLDLLLLLPPLLDPKSEPLSRDSTALLLSNPPLSDLDALLPDLAALLSSHLRSMALNLARITHPSTNSSYLHRHIPTLYSSFDALAQGERTAHQELVKARLETLGTLLGLLDTYAASLTHLIRGLEAKHGVVARSVDLKASQTALHAQHAQVKVESALHGARGEIYTPQAQVALKNYASHLRDAKIRTEERVKGLTAELGEYGVGADGDKERKMREMARVYREMSRKMDDAKGDLERLRRG